MKEEKLQRKIRSRTDRSKFKKSDQDQRKKQIKGPQEGGKRGRVLGILGDAVSVACEGEIINCSIRGKLKQERGRDKNLLTVGDFVLFHPDGAIFYVEPRKSILSRKEHTHGHKQHLLAANIDQVLITVSLGEPPLKPALVDRYIIATKKGNMEPVIVINKIDLLDQEKELYEEFIQVYQALKLPLLPVSCETGEGLEALKERMKERASVFSGQSGVGKSSLINEICNLSLPIGDVVKKTKKGGHTTTAAQLLPLEFGGFCIDTPGIRSFGIWDLRREDLIAYFPEITEQARNCKFSNCTHSHEPECAVIDAIDEGKISPMRFSSYLRLLADCVS